MKRKYSKAIESNLFMVLFILAVSAACFAESKLSATRAKMSCLKYALLSYKNDFGHFPFAGIDSGSAKAYFIGHQAGLGFTNSTNCLVTDKILYFKNLGLDEKTYRKKWKGPYIDGSPDDFLYDCWKTPFVIIKYENDLYLWSAGHDGDFDHIENILSGDYKGNDLHLSVARLSRSVGKTSTIGVTSYAKRHQIPGGTWEPPTMIEQIMLTIKYRFTHCD